MPFSTDSYEAQQKGYLFNSALSSFFRIFPVAVIGRASRNSTMRGYLYTAICSLHQAIKSSSARDSPCLRTT
jgi:hypothetical protein